MPAIYDGNGPSTYDILCELCSSYWKEAFASFRKVIRKIEPDEQMTFEKAMEEIEKASRELSSKFHVDLKVNTGKSNSVESLTFHFHELDSWLDRTFSVYGDQKNNQIRIGKLPSDQAFSPSQYKQIIKWIELYMYKDTFRLERLVRATQDSCELNIQARRMAFSSLEILVKTLNEAGKVTIDYDVQKNPLILKVSKDGKAYEVYVSFKAVLGHLPGLKNVLMNPGVQNNNAFPCFLIG